MEVFKSIPDFDNYKVSTLGNVISFMRYIDGRILHKQKESIGYLSVKLPNEGKFKTVLIHRLVAQVFTTNPENKPQVNHIDGDKMNNNVLNLEWCTSSENPIHAYNAGLTKAVTGENNGASKLKEIDITNIRELSKTLSARKIAKHYKMPNSVISDIINGNTWKSLKSNN